jgi:uncharacterized iron-regulated protein
MRWTKREWIVLGIFQVLTVGLVAIALPFADIPAAIAAPASTLTHPTATVFRVDQQQAEPIEQSLRRFAQANVVYLGETHDSATDHQAQLDILTALQQQRPQQITIGLEMFQRPFQPLLDQYLRGEISEIDLVNRSQYRQRWGYDWALYAPIVRFAQAHQLPLLALNTPTEITRKVAKNGLDGLSVVERQWIPPKSAVVLGPPRYRQRLREIYEQVHQGKSSSFSFERFFLAQVLWDETMAEQIAATLQKYPERLVVVLAGQGHLIYGDGIPDRVARRMALASKTRSLQQLTVLLNPTPDAIAEAKTNREEPISDYLWVTASELGHR